MLVVKACLIVFLLKCCVYWADSQSYSIIGQKIQEVTTRKKELINFILIM